MTVYISPNPGKAMAYGISQRAAQILLTHGAQVLMQDGLQAECMTMGVEYLSQKECLCLLYTSPSPRDISGSRMPSSA